MFLWYDGDDATNAMMTMYNMIGLNMIDIENPAESSLVTKPLEQDTTVASSVGPVTGVWHGGGPKIAAPSGSGAEGAFVDFIDFIEIYTTCRTEAGE